jgi:hypothetical protein
MWTWLEQWLKGTRPAPSRTWRPKIRQRQFMHRQRLYGGGWGDQEPPYDINEDDMPTEPGRRLVEGDHHDYRDDPHERADSADH